MDQLTLRYGGGGAGTIGIEAWKDAGLPNEQFGTIAEAACTFPPGRWRIKTTSDDGIRVWMDDELVIDDWTWHPPKEHVHDFLLAHGRTINIRVEHFELDGYSILTLEIEKVR